MTGRGSVVALVVAGAGCAAGLPVAGKLALVNASADVVSYRGRRALHLAPGPGPSESILAIADQPEGFGDGTIEVDVAGAPRAGVDPGARGFIGVAFRVDAGAGRFELLYLRPTNGRADDQVRRNHTTQYEALPDYPWDRLRAESPGVYESYVDVEAGAWTHLRVVVAGTRAELYVDGAARPCLIVHDLKLGPSRGRVGLWAHVTTDAYFADLRVRPAL
jgi:hypothetical protein